MSVRRIWCLLVGCLLAASAQAVWLEGVRWFKHEAFVRVVFDLSAPAQYRISERLQDGYVDLVLQGELNRRMPEEIRIGESGVIAARQLRKTSTSLTWRVQVEGMARVKHMAIEETPYKIAIDFYPASGKGAAAKVVRPKAETQVAEDKAIKPQASKTADAKAAGAKAAASKGEAASPKSGAHRAAEPAKGAASASKHDAAKAKSAPDPKAKSQAEAKARAEEAAKAKAQAEALAAAKAAEEAKIREQAKAAASVQLPPEELRLAGLGTDERRRLQVGELLLQLGDTSGARPYLEKVAEHKPDHAWTRILLAQTFLANGDEYRARQLLEPLLKASQWKDRVEPMLARLTPPDAQGQVPGGEMPEEDLSFYLGVLRQGGGLKPAELYREAPEEVAEPAKGSFLSGTFVGALLGVVAFAVAEWRRRKQMDRLVRERIMGEPSAAAPSFAGLGIQSSADMTEVSRRVREELEQVMQAERSDAANRGDVAGRSQEPSFASVFEAASNAPAPDSLEERIYSLSDQRKSIVEIAEELNLGVDEVRLHLSLREQAGQVANG